jgi:hypothetical protein
LKVHRRFGGIYRLHQGWRVSQINQHEASFAGLRHVCFLLGLLFNPICGGACSSETSVDFQGLHGVVSRKTELFMTVLLSRKVRDEYPFLAGGGKTPLHLKFPSQSHVVVWLAYET